MAVAVAVAGCKEMMAEWCGEQAERGKDKRGEQGGDGSEEEHQREGR